MKVKELIEKLKELDEELDVWVETSKENADFLIKSDYVTMFTRIKQLSTGNGKLIIT